MGDIIVPASQLIRFTSQVLGQSLPEDEAEIIAETLVDADLLGVESHGVSRLAGYLKRMEDGLIERKTRLTLVRETPTTALFDAANGWGQVAAVKALETAIEKALQYGTGFVGVKNSNHFGTASYFTRMATEKDCIGLAMTNASAIMVPFGSKEPSLGTNPISIAVPTGEGRNPVVLDMATSQVARGKIILAKKKGETIPAHWAITVNGEPTTDPVKALEGFVLPLGPKGSGLAIMIDILSGVLTGALFGKQIPKMYGDQSSQQLGHFFGVIHIEAFMDKTLFYQRMQEKVQETVNSAPMEGFDRVYMPGEIELSRKKVRLEKGIPLPKEIYLELKETGSRYGVDIEKFILSKEVKQ
ncbi:LDH2 family malate/lactate/ureidoglycolate dehydrogenase [Caldalkalibacillus uzonensis]|uniref:LDH2 family malate/lactate/ureidoglycolate dehydrogenase n=1 Tax=Caldalkalibacillus uzonensis TaxID=353224 RepID=A0ABU0CNW5_9BACI|nr:Ldh family oxidoreductase [Caldalkalibacillus uzonensis]MDQ0338105.1 LDH2 family malate/lactate/ureidoglycolate dehydrogenase [Caldalkalibacillus uzonensis]